MKCCAIICSDWPPKLLRLRAALVVLGGFLVHLSIGTIYTYGNMVPYVVSYIRNQSHPEDLAQATSTWVFACALIGQGGAMFIGGWLVKKIGPRFTTLLGGWIMSAGVALTYFTIKVSFWLVLLTYGILFGIGVGIAYIGPLSSAMKWFPKWKGIANGVVVAGFGLGALIFDAVQTFYINPQNLSADSDKHFTEPELLDRVPTMFLILAGTYAVMQLVGSLLITNPPDEYFKTDVDENPEVSVANGQYREIADEGKQAELRRLKKRREGLARDKKKLSHSPSESLSTVPGSPGKQRPILNHDSADVEHQEKCDFSTEKKNELDAIESDRLLENDSSGSDDLSYRSKSSVFEGSTSSASSPFADKNIATSIRPLQMLRKPSFYLLWLMFMFNGCGVILVATLYKSFGQEFINNDHYLAVVGSISAIFNCLGRIVWGWIADTVSYKFALVVLNASLTVFLLTFYTSSLGGKEMYFIWVCIIFFCVGGNFSVFPTAVARCFGLKYVSINYGLLFTSQIVAGSVGSLVATTLNSLIKFYGLMFVVSFLTTLSFIISLLYKPKRYITLNM